MLSTRFVRAADAYGAYNLQPHLDYGSAIEDGLRALLNFKGPSPCECTAGPVRRLCVACCTRIAEKNAAEVAEREKRRRAFWNPYYMACRLLKDVGDEMDWLEKAPGGVDKDRMRENRAVLCSLLSYVTEFEDTNWYLFAVPPSERSWKYGGRS